MSQAFCPTCRTMKQVMDEYRTGPRDKEYVARPLECGHDAGDGGGLPYRPRPVNRRREQALVERVAELQEGQQ